MAREKWMIDSEKVIDIERVRTLKVGLVAGQIDIIGHDEPGGRIEVHSVQGRGLRVSIDDDAVEITHPRLRWDNFIDVLSSWRDGSAKADISVRVPRDVALKFGVVSASGLITGLRGDASMSTVGGDLIIDDMHGSLQLNAVNGEITVHNHDGPIVAHTVNGDITVAGEVPWLTATAVSGDVFLAITGSPDRITAHTVSGEVTTLLDPDVALQYSINTVGGRVLVDNSEVRRTRGSFTGVCGTLDRQWLEFAVNTVSGNVSVLHTVVA